MKIQFPLTSAIFRWSLGGLTLLLVGVVVFLSSLRFVVSVVANPRIPVDFATIEAAARYFPDSAKLQARLAASLVESQPGNFESHELLADRAFFYARRAVRLAPENHQYRLLLAAAAELRGEMTVAEDSLREAARLAPRDINVRWQMANLCLRIGKIEDALAEFRIVAASDPARLSIVMSLVWQATGGNFEMLDRTISQQPEARLAFAQFLLEQAQLDASVRVFGHIDRNDRLKMPESGRYFDTLVRAKRWQAAGELWAKTLAGQPDGTDPFWNGGFEKPIRKSFAQFDWQLAPCNFARLQIAEGAVRSGQHALMIAYKGVDTTRLDGEAKHAVSVQPGGAYRLEFFAKSEKLVTPEGPQIAILRAEDLTVIASSIPVSAGSTDWQWMTVDFTAPNNTHAVWVTIKQTPQFSYVEPTSGIVRFDDFSLKAL